MTTESLFPQHIVAQYHADGFWPNTTICHYLDTAIAQTPDKTALVDPFERLTYADLGPRVDRLALGLLDIGIGPGDVVSFQLPNWNAFAVIQYALSRIGAVANPLIPIYRHRELRFMMQLAASKAMIIPRQFRGFDYTKMMRDLRPELPALERIYVLGDDVPDDMLAFDDLLAGTRLTPQAIADLHARQVNPNALSEIIFTSGTTGEPKGVMHTHNTILCPILAAIERLQLNADTVVLMASTFAHQTGYLFGVHMPVVLGGKGVFMDVWQAARAVELIEAEGVTWTMGATPFLSDLAYAPNLEQHHLETLQLFLSAGAAIPRQLVMDARERLGCAISAGWGMTENALVTVNQVDDPPEKVFGTDGCCVNGMEVQVVSDDGQPLPPGEEGDLVSRGPQHFAGYYQRPRITAESLTEDGWFKTGDRAILDNDGYISICGRSKDIIIRGGENIPVVEVENLLHKHPKVLNVAIVGMPDARLQEKACAFVIPQPGEMLTFGDIVDYLLEQQLAKQYLPERLEIVTEFPMTPSGKVQKYQLRQHIAMLLEQEGN
ncbi:AMP-binding protein [Candidatus Entotheonella palauensis]|uniref:AMP-binding protein n=1 Tax=Candidatus Entotheonella palauensis TaxID=93172 RepID=UPI000B7F8B27|nr:AMP-binding protein [Candidatus Entotheonella palauensis]